MLMTPSSSKCEWIFDRAKKAISVFDRAGFWGFVRLLCVSIRSRLMTIFIKYRVAKDAKLSASKISGCLNGRGLFIDCGSNIGQGFTYFRKFYPLSIYDYILVEPNPNCIAGLVELSSKLNGNIKIIGEAASTCIGEVRLYGLSEGNGNGTTEGGSIVKEHNGIFYSADEGGAISVRTFSLSDLIESEKTNYSSIILKLDIEGEEYVVLDDMIKNQTHLCLDFVYVEFHSEYMLEPKRSIFRLRESGIINKFSADHVPFRLWI